MIKNIAPKYRLALALAGLSLLAPANAFASQGQGLPWEGPLAKLAASLSGPVAQSICLIAIVVAGLSLIWGGEMNDVTRKIVIVVLVVAIVLGAAGLMINLFGASGALM